MFKLWGMCNSVVDCFCDFCDALMLFVQGDYFIFESELRHLLGIIGVGYIHLQIIAKSVGAVQGIKSALFRDDNVSVRLWV